VLELIQKAYDNEYSDGTRPILRFEVNDNMILAQSNEEGLPFREDR